LRENSQARTIQATVVTVGIGKTPPVNPNARDKAIPSGVAPDFNTSNNGIINLRRNQEGAAGTAETEEEEEDEELNNDKDSIDDVVEEAEGGTRLIPDIVVVVVVVVVEVAVELMFVVVC